MKNDSHRGLVVRGVHHRFGPIVAADDVDIDVLPGEVHCLLGPSGSGKSTLLRLVAGLERLQRGTISIGGRVVAGEGIDRPPEERAVGFVFQDYALFPHLDARHNVAFGVRRGTRREKLGAADAWLERVGLASSAEAMPHTLSGGQQQRVALARALAREPEIMLLDEPFSSLDQQLRGAIRRTALDLLHETGAATLMITHDPTEALVAGDRVSVIRDGRILQTGRPDEVYRRASSRRVAEVFGPVNRFESTARDGRAASPWGEIEAIAPDGSPLEGEVEILVRAEALRLEPIDPEDPSGPRGRIRAVEPAGPLATIRVDLEGLADEGLAVEVNDLARRGWRAGEAVEVVLDAGSASVLPLDRTDRAAPRLRGPRLRES